MTVQNLSKVERKILNCLIRVKVHERDLVYMYNEKKVANVNDFNWQQMVRHYWSEDKCQVRCYLSET